MQMLSISRKRLRDNDTNFLVYIVSLLSSNFLLVDKFLFKFLLNIYGFREDFLYPKSMSVLKDLSLKDNLKWHNIFVCRFKRFFFKRII